MFDFFEEVKAEIVKDPRGAETLIITKTRSAMSKVLDNHFDNRDDKMRFLSNYGRSRGHFVTLSPNQEPLLDWVADRLKTTLIAQDVFDDHFDDKWEYVNWEEIGGRYAKVKKQTVISRTVKVVDDVEIDEVVTSDFPGVKRGQFMFLWDGQERFPYNTFEDAIYALNQLKGEPTNEAD